MGFCWCCGDHRLNYQPLFGKMSLHSGNWAYGNHCWFAFVLWCGDHSLSFVLHVNVHHFVIAPASNAKKVQPYFFYIKLSINYTKVKVFNKKCVRTLVNKELKQTVFIPGFSGSITKVTKCQKVQLLKYCTKFHRFTRITDHQDGCRNTTRLLTLPYSTCKLLSLTSSCTNYEGSQM